MSIFEHLMTLSSFMLALGIATILTFLARLYHRRGQVRLSAAHLLWVAGILLGQIVFWLGSYSFSGTQRSSLPTIGFVILQPILLYLQSALVAPDREDIGDLAAYHATEGRSYMAVCAVTELLFAAYMLRISALNPGFVPGSFFFQQAILVALIAAAMLLRWTWLQITVPALLLASRLSGFYVSSQFLIQ